MMGTMSNFEEMVTKKHDLEFADRKEKIIQNVVAKIQKKLKEPEIAESEPMLEGLDDDEGDAIVDMPSTPSLHS